MFGVKIGREKFHCLWDTGATVCLISKQLVKEAGLKSQQFEFPCVKRINGISNNSIVSTTGVRFDIQFNDKVNREVECIVCDVVPHDLILGLSFMRRYTLSFRTKLGAGFALRDDKSGKTVASTYERGEGVEGTEGHQQANVAEEQVTAKKGTIHPDLQQAFNCHLADVKLEQVLGALLNDGRYEIDDQELTPEAKVLVAGLECHFASQQESCFSAQLEDWNRY